MPGRTDQRVLIPTLGITQLLGWGTTFYLPAVLAPTIAADTGWPFAWVVGGVSLGLLVAGLVSPRVGRAVDRYGGRPVVALSSLLLGAGLAGVGLAPTLPWYLAAWALIGAGMGAGLYDAVFAALGRLFGAGARGAITTLTLFGGFASTVCWPLSAFMVENLGWRGACLVYAAVHLCIALPVHWLIFPRETIRIPQRSGCGTGAANAGSGIGGTSLEGLVFLLLAVVQAVVAAIGAIVIVHLLTLVQARGLGAEAAVWLGTLFGPAQVAARFVERLFGPHYHPIWTMVAAAGAMALGLALFLASVPALALAVVIYAAGYGVSWVARGTLPLALFGPERYPALIGRLAFPSLISQALAPWAGAVLIAWAGAETAIAVLAAAAFINLIFVGALWGVCRGVLRRART